MKSTIEEIFSGNPGESVHGEFVKFSKGVFPDRYLVESKKQKDGWSIKTGPEYANFLVRKCLEKAKGPVEVNGVITATFDVSSKANFPIEEVKNALGIKKAVVNASVDPSKVIELMNSFPRAFFALSFSIPGTVLKIKPKAPKSAKPSSGGDKELKIDFCSLKTEDSDIAKSLLFGVGETKKVVIKHVISIDSIELPKGVSDPVQIREKSKRKGKVTRIIDIEGSQTKSEADFFI